MEEFSKICQIIVPIMRKQLKFTAVDLLQDLEIRDNYQQRRIMAISVKEQKKRGLTPIPK